MRTTSPRRIFLPDLRFPFGLEVVQLHQIISDEAGADTADKMLCEIKGDLMKTTETLRRKGKLLSVVFISSPFVPLGYATKHYAEIHYILI